MKERPSILKKGITSHKLRDGWEEELYSMRSSAKGFSRLRFSR